MYREAIIGGEIKEELVNKVLPFIRYMSGDLDFKDVPEDFPFNKPESYFSLFLKGYREHIPAHFRIHKTLAGSMYFSTRFSIKDSENIIDDLVSWLYEIIETGSGADHTYAIVLDEGTSEVKTFNLI
jgi:hypothetical protein